jgi:DNA-binding NarL/FixJ family response regulator
MPNISIYIVSPYAFVSDLLQHRLTTTKCDIFCTGTWDALDGLDDAMDRACPDVVVLDTALCNSEAPDIITTYLNRHPALKFVLLYDRETVGTALKCLVAGAKASISKQCAFDKFLAVVRAAYSGEVVVPSDLLTLLVDRVRDLEHSEKIAGEKTVSVREAAILTMVADGATNNEIADSLGLSPQTVKNCLTKLYFRLGVGNRLQAATWWRDRS